MGDGGDGGRSRRRVSDSLPDGARMRRDPGDGEPVSDDSGVGSARAWCDDREVEAQDPIHPLGEYGGDLRVRRAGPRPHASAGGQGKRRAGEDRDRCGSGHDNAPPAAGALQAQGLDESESPARAEACEKPRARCGGRLGSATADGSTVVRGRPILGGSLERIMDGGGALAPKVRRTRRGLGGGEGHSRGFFGRSLGLLLLALAPERNQLLVRADPIPELDDVLRRVLTAVFGLRDFPLHLVADPLQVFLLLAGPGCPD